MDGEEVEVAVGDEEQVASIAALLLRKWKQTSLDERTFIRPGAAGKLDPPSRWQRHPGAEEEAGGREAAAAVEAE